MKFINTLCQTGAVLGLLLTCTPAFALPEKDTGNLGEIRQSILKVDDFRRIYGEGWVLMDGANIKTSDLYKEGLWEEETIPDAQGVYLRSKNHERAKEKGDPDGDRKLGAYIEDRLKSHSHDFDLCIPTTQGTGGAHAPAQGSGSYYRNTPVGGQIKGNGDAETCPRSIVVNTFIKINRTPDSQQLNVILKAIQGVPAKVLGSDAFRQILQRLGRATGQSSLPAPAALE